MIPWSWKGPTEAHSVFYSGFINVSRKLMWEFVDGFQCSKIVYLICCFDDFEFIDLILVLYMFCENAVDRCWRMSNFNVWFVLQCFCFRISGSWKCQTEASCVFWIGFKHVSRKLMWEFVEGCQCSNFVNLILCVWLFRIH